jgi:hypothetical protein
MVGQQVNTLIDAYLGGSLNAWMNGEVNESTYGKRWEDEQIVGWLYG